MLIEQIFASWLPEFEFGPSGRTCSPKAGYFQDKTKISEANLEVNHY